jgi:hypothetical protein
LRFHLTAVGITPTFEVARQSLLRHCHGGIGRCYELVIAVKVVTPEAPTPGLGASQLGMRNPKRVVLHAHAVVTFGAKPIGNGNAATAVLTVTALAPLRGNGSACLDEPGFVEPEYGVPFVLTSVTGKAILVLDVPRPEVDRRSPKAQDVARVRLQLLSNRPGSGLVTLGAGEILVPGIHRAWCA